MKKLLLWVSLILTLGGFSTALLGFYMDTDYAKLRKKLSAGLVGETTLFLSPEEKKFLDSLTMVEKLDEIENDFHLILSNWRLSDPFRKKMDYNALRVKVKEGRSKISGTSWQDHAGRGQLAVRDLVLGIVNKSNEQELKQIWQEAANAYKEARLSCDLLLNVEEYKLCVDLTTKNYEFLVKPSQQGGLGDLASSGKGDDKSETLNIPLIRGSGASGAAGSFGQR